MTTLPKLKKEGREEFEKKFLQFSYCGNRTCEYEEEDKCFHASETVTKAFLTAQIEKAYLSALSDIEDELPQGVITETHEIINKLKQSHE